MAGNTWNAINSQVPYQLMGGSGSGPVPPHDHEPSQTFSFGRYVTVGGGIFDLTTFLGSAGMGSLIGVPAAMGVPVSIASGSIDELEFFTDDYVVTGIVGNPFLTLVSTIFDGTATTAVNLPIPIASIIAGDKVVTIPVGGLGITQTDYLSMSISATGNFIFPAVRFVVKET